MRPHQIVVIEGDDGCTLTDVLGIQWLRATDQKYRVIGDVLTDAEVMGRLGGQEERVSPSTKDS